MPGVAVVTNELQQIQQQSHIHHAKGGHCHTGNLTRPAWSKHLPKPNQGNNSQNPKQLNVKCDLVILPDGQCPKDGHNENRPKQYSSKFLRTRGQACLNGHVEILDETEHAEQCNNATERGAGDAGILHKQASQ